MSLRTGADVGPYVVLGPARREPRHARADGARRPPRVWQAEPFGGGEPVALVGTGADPTGEDTVDGSERAAADLLRREWALTGSLRHPHIVAVLDLLEGDALRPGGSGSADDRSAADPGPVLVTGWGDRGSLAAMLRTGTLTAGQTVTVLAALTAGLAACHERGLVHGDVQPDTVVVTWDGRPQLIRCGRATAAVDRGAGPVAEPRCASPDVARGRVATVMDDVFSLGAVAMQCLTGRPTWPARDLRDVVVQSEFGQWPTVADEPAAGPALAALVDAMLDADPTARPALREVLARLAHCPAPQPLPDVPVPPTPVDGGRHARPEPAAPEPDVVVPPVTVDGRHRWNGRDDRVAPWSRVVVPVVVLAVVIAGAVGAGVWWAGRDRPTAAALPVDPAVATLAPVTAAGSAEPAVPAVDWAAVVRALDDRRAAAFAAADPTLLREVWAVTAPGLVEDDTRIRGLQSRGLRVAGLVHEIGSVEHLNPDADPTALPVLAVTDTLPAATVLDADGATVGTTTPVDSARRILTLEPVGGGFRIASVTPGGG